MRFTLLLPAAGDGARLGENIPKALVEIGGLPLFVHALIPFNDLADCKEIVIAAPAGSVTRFQDLIRWYFPDKRLRVIAGGGTRQDSVGLALEASTESTDLLMVHDAARPFIARELIERVRDGITSGFVACAPALALTDTLKRAYGDPLTVERTVERRALFAVQTPQAIAREALEEVYRRLGSDPFEGTDDVSLIEHFGLGNVRLVEGDPRNLKITTGLDLKHARELLSATR